MRTNTRSDSQFHKASVLQALVVGVLIHRALLRHFLYFELGEKENLLKEAEKARDEWETIVAAYPKVKPQYYAHLAICYALEGDREQVESITPKIRALTETVNWKFRRQADCELKIAVAYLVLGDHEKAIEILQDASRLPSPIFVNRELDLWFIFDRLRGNPRFDKLLED
ncbi:MAG: hypothetical protein O7C75_02015 [Verrucomicrobia bacterium]|nr:hypothetical protein [Verrucomicrobiota bacterium]